MKRMRIAAILSLTSAAVVAQACGGDDNGGPTTADGGAHDASVSDGSLACILNASCLASSRRAKTFSSSHAMGAGPTQGMARTVSTAQNTKRLGR